MKKLFMILMCAMALGMVLPQEANAAKKKEKKEKKAFEWVMPELTGNENFDIYLLKCDTMYNRITHYTDSITFYDVAEIHVIDEKGEKDIRYHVVDAEGNLRSANKAFQQNMDIILAYPQIALDMTLIATYTAGATAALPGLGIKALSYGKYVKVGPKIVSMGGATMKTIYKKARAQAKQIKALKAGKIDDVKALNAEVNAGNVDAGAATIRVIEKQKKDYEAEFGKITKEDNETPITNDDIPEEEA